MRRLFILAAPFVSMALHALAAARGATRPWPSNPPRMRRRLRAARTSSGAPSLASSPPRASTTRSLPASRVGRLSWTAAGGHADADLGTGAMAFSVDGLVINGSQFSGTPGPITAVVGTLVCDPGTANEVARDTPPVP